MIKVAHLADIHIRNLKYHDVYRSVFHDLYKKLRKQKPDYIVVCGDIAHTKTQISPEYVKMASDFFINLADIAKTIVIPGNHDGLVKNVYRLDAISPIIENIESDDLYFVRESAVIEFDDVEFYHLSIFDRENWPKPRDNKKIKVALYHGAINNVETDIGFTIKHGDDRLSIFNGFDFAMLGDIHKTNQILDKEETVRYPGSLITQNFGETNDKGYLFWKIKSRKDFKCKHHQLDNPKPFITIKLTPKGRIPYKLDVPKGARLRLVSENHISLDAMRKAIDVVKTKFKPESVSYLNRASGSRKLRNLDVDEFSNKNLRDIGVQHKLIKEYLKDYDLEEGAIKRILEINREINSLIEKNDDVARNVYWSIDSVEYDNLFNYGEGNKINFENLNGLIGIFGKSFSGKSSIVDSILFTLFNSSSKSVRKNLNMINQNKNYANGKVILTINDEKYAIERRSEKYIKKLHGVESEEASTSVEFYKIGADGEKIDEGNLAEESRRDTDKAIRHKIGKLDDFLVTSFSAQFGSLAFIDQKSTDRKKTLAKFLDLEFFEDKFREANEQSSHMRGALKLLENVDYDNKYEEIKSEKGTLKKRKNSIFEQKEELRAIILELEKEISETGSFIESVPAELGGFCHIEDDLAELRKELNRKEVYLKASNNKLKDRKEFLEEIKKEVEELDEKDLDLLKHDLERIRKRVIDKFDDKIHYSNLIDQIEEAEKNISEAPCHSEYSSCYLVESSHEFLKNLEDKLKVREKFDKIKEEYQKLEDKASELEALNIDEELTRLNDLRTSIESIEEGEIPLLEANIDKNRAEIKDIRNSIKTMESKWETYKENEEKVNLLEEKTELLAKLTSDLEKAKNDLENVREQEREVLNQEGYIKRRIESIIEDRKRLKEMREEYAAYDLYKKCMHANGIPFDIIKKRLPVINTEISKILANVVDFEVFFKTDGNKLEIYIKHPKHEARLIETGSGAEKTLAATAIRLALLSVSSLPKGDIFILDEPATELDDDTKEGFLRILEMIKGYFSKVILISHLEPLKDIVDTEITIEKKNGYAHVEI